jgi:16S rRNA (cytidine1402-2'-O)-methyltransferase
MNINSTSSHKNNEPESSVLYIVGTPIGNLSDLSSRALNVLKNVSLVACEDTRQTKKIMNKYQFTNKLISFNKHNSFKKTPGLINLLNSGQSIALVSDAGMPGICDPGEKLVNSARTKGIRIVCVPGPCAALTALVSSGLPSSRFTFEGFLPKKKSERQNILLEISKNNKTTILFESPNRLKDLLIELKEYLGGERKVHISRELTKKFEEHIGDSINEIMTYLKDKDVLGEITIVIKGRESHQDDFAINEFELKKELNDLVEAGLSLSKASKYLARKNNLTKSLIYNMY